MSNKYSQWVATQNSFGKRLDNEKKHSYRNDFERDRDRIMYSKSFRRLSGKTQVFISRFSDHTRTRLTHTLEVNQIAKTIGKQLHLNNDLIEAIALGHDLGHTPFGHVGERTLNKILSGGFRFTENFMKENPHAFKHNLNSVYIVSEYEKKDRRYNGLNLTDKTIYGICHHSKLRYKNDEESKYSYYDEMLSTLIMQDSWSFESDIVKISDEISQRHHDIEDGLITNIIGRDEIIELIYTLFKQDFKSQHNDILRRIKNEKNINYVINGLSTIIVDILTSDITKTSKDHIFTFIKDNQLKNANDFMEYKRHHEKQETIISYSVNIEKKDKKLQDFLKNRILSSYQVQSLDGKAEYLIRKIAEAYFNNPQQLSDTALIRIFNTLGEIKPDTIISPQLIGDLRSNILSVKENKSTLVLRSIVNSIATMTDDYAYKEYDRLYGTKR